MSSTEFDSSATEEENDDEDYRPSSDSETEIVNAEYLREIVSTLNDHNVIDSGNALALNKEMQRRLVEVRTKLQQLLDEVKHRYANNEYRLQENMKRGTNGVGMRGAYLKGGTFFFQGNMFFKDRNCRNCPNNADYLQRSAAGELFPMDLELRGRHVWSLADKAGIVEAIKEQVIVHLGGDCAPRDICAVSEKQKRDIAVHSERLVNLLARVDDKFDIDWQQVAIHNLNRRHSASSCKAMWLMYLHPSLKRDSWTADENNTLLESAKSHALQNWDEIAFAVGKRSAYQCFVQYQTDVSYMQPDRWDKWTKEDDERLMCMIERYTVHGVIKWNAISQHFPRKPKCSIVQRFTDYLDPRLSHASFSPEEDLLLLTAVQEYGTKFSRFPRMLFPNRSVMQLRTRYRNTLQNRHKHTAWTLADDEQLMEFIQENGISSWQLCAETLEHKHSRTSCRTRFLTILKYFKKNPNALLSDLPRKKTHYSDTAITTENWIEKVSELRENPLIELQNDKSPPPKTKAKKEKPTHSKKNVPTKQLKTTARPKRRRKIHGEIVQKDVCRNGNNRACRRKPVYVERLRANELQFYNYFKYAYNFRLGQDQDTHGPQYSHPVYQMMTAMRFNLPKNQPYLHGVILQHSIRQRCKTLFKKTDSKILLTNGHFLPPSWATLMSFRALCIHTTQGTTTATKSTVTAQHDAIVLFRMRLRALLHHTILLSRIHPDSINSQYLKDLYTQARTPLSQSILQDNVKSLESHPQKENNQDKAKSQQIESEMNECSSRKRLKSRNQNAVDLKRKCEEFHLLNVKVKVES